MAILIAIDGVDSSGKETQTKLLCDKLKKDGYNVERITFPNYDGKSSTIVKMYLAGEFGTHPDDVNAYAASSFFAIDRYASFKTDWGKMMDDDLVVIADRYVSSNMIHQAGKIKNPSEKERFIEWLEDFEFNKLELPYPEITIFLDMPVGFAQKLMAERANKFTGEQKKDIHESDIEYLKSSYDNACLIAEKMKWERISCIDDNNLRTIEDINEEIYTKVKSILNK